VLLLGGALAFFLYRRREFAVAKAAVAANAYVIEASQLRGPAQFTTYSATYNPFSAPLGVVRPGSAKRPSPLTVPGRVTGPFPEYSSPRGVTTPRAESAMSGTYTTLSAKAAV